MDAEKTLPRDEFSSRLREQDSTITQQRRRGARQAVETRRARGDSLGNADALRKARSAPRKAKRRRVKQ